MAKGAAELALDHLASQRELGHFLWVTTAAKKVLDDALALSDEERAELMAALSDSLQPTPVTLDARWKGEIEDRIGQVERGEVEPVAWEQVEAGARARLARR